MKRIRNPFFILLILFMLPLQTRAAEFLVPVGKVIGLQLRDGSVSVAAYDDALGSCARDAGLKIGDEIIKMNGYAVDSAEDVRSILNRSREQVTLTVRRGGKYHILHLFPKNTGDGQRMGVYLTQGIAGIGTVTWYDPETGKFGTLGHGVNSTAGQLLNMTDGNAFTARVDAVKKGKCGEPGQLRGNAEAASLCGSLLRNTPQGVFGISHQGWRGEAVPVADFDEVHTGAATIRSTVQGDRVQEYSVEILKIYPKDRTNCRNFLLKVTDPDLIALTGGIVQGMSGSPILQDGKLVGAVTHVLVNDPTRGYGIFIENMLDAAG